MALRGPANSRIPGLTVELVWKVRQPTDLQRFPEQLRMVKRNPSHAWPLVSGSVESGSSSGLGSRTELEPLLTLVWHCGLRESLTVP